MKYILLILAVTTCSVMSVKNTEEIAMPDPIQVEIDRLNEWLSN